MCLKKAEGGLPAYTNLGRRDATTKVYAGDLAL